MNVFSVLSRVRESLETRFLLLAVSRALFTNRSYQQVQRGERAHVSYLALPPRPFSRGCIPACCSVRAMVCHKSTTATKRDRFPFRWAIFCNSWRLSPWGTLSVVWVLSDKLRNEIMVLIETDHYLPADEWFAHPMLGPIYVHVVPSSNEFGMRAAPKREIESRFHTPASISIKHSPTEKWGCRHYDLCV